MKKIINNIILLITVVALTGCAGLARHHHGNYTQDMHAKLKKYDGYAAERLQPYFKRAHMQYPPKQITLIVFKHTKRMQLWARSSEQGKWHYIRTFPILAASGGPGPKLHDMDHQVPEGIYHIAGFNPDSRFDLSMELNYPNAFDHAKARIDRRTNLGDNIFIHGSNRSIGCMAMGNKVIPELFVLAHKVGRHNVTVIIAPNDIRYQKPIYGRVHPTWLPELYTNIRHALAPFKGHV